MINFIQLAPAQKLNVHNIGYTVISQKMPTFSGIVCKSVVHVQMMEMLQNKQTLVNVCDTQESLMLDKWRHMHSIA